MHTLIDALKRLETADLIRAAKLEPDLEYQFRHALVQEAAYISLLKEDRRKLHRAVALSLEALYPDKLDDLAAVLAHHYDAAGDPTAAVRYYVRASEAAERRFATHEGILHYTRALELTPVEDAAARFDLHLKRVSLYHILGARPEQREDVHQLIALAEQLGEPLRRAQAALAQITLSISTGDYATSLQAAEQAVGWAQQASTVELEARAHLYWAMALWRQSELDAAHAHLERSLALARAAHLPAIEADSLRNLGIIADYRGDPAAAWMHTEQALPLYRRLGDRRGEAAVLNSLGAIAISGRRFEEGRRLIEESLELKRLLGQVPSIAVSLGNLGVVANEQADYNAALHYHEESLALCRRVGDIDGEAASLSGLADAANRIGAFERAWALGHESLGLSRQINDPLGESTTLLILGMSALRRGDAPQALSLSEQGLTIARQIGVRETERLALAQIGHIHAQMGNRNAALLTLEQVADQTDKWSAIAHAELADLQRTAGALDDARPHIEKVLAYLDPHEAEMLGDLRVYLIAWQVLDLLGDARAQRVLTRAYELLQHNAARLPDDARRSYLENIAEHRAIVAAWQSSRPA